MVSASGNSFHAYGDTQGVAYPAADPNSLFVGAVYDADEGRQPPPGYVYGDGSYANTTDADRIAPFSQRDDQLTTVMAPGAVITAAAMGGGVTDMSGTSMAAPHVAGMAVLAQQLAMQELGQPLTQDQFADLLQETGTTVNDGDDEDDNVTNTDLDFPRADMHALGEAILDLHWHVTADDGPSSASDDGNPDTFHLSRDMFGTIAVSINYEIVEQGPIDDVLRVTLEGSSDSDTFVVYGLDSYGFDDFLGNVVIHGEGDGDTAQLNDSPGADTFKAYPTSARFDMEDAYSIFVYANQSIHALSVNGGDDTAVLYDLEGSEDTFKAWPDEARLYGDTFFNRANGFRGVIGESDDQTAEDKAVFYDLEGSEDTFKAWPDEARLYGDGFFNRANGFRRVVAQSGDQAAEDMALFYDNPAGADEFRAWAELAKLYDEGTFFNQAESFRWVHAYSEGGGDLARLYDSPGDDTFRAWDAGGQNYEAKLYDTPGTFYNMVHSFRTVKAYAEEGSGGDDVAQLWDSTGDDLLQARDGDPGGEDWVLLRDEAAAAYAVWAYGVDEVWADSGTGGDDTLDEGPNLDFLLHATGMWEN